MAAPRRSARGVRWVMEAGIVVAVVRFGSVVGMVFLVDRLSLGLCFGGVVRCLFLS